MQSFVRFVNSNNFKEFVAVDSNSAKVLLFTEKKSTPPLLKALSKEFKGSVVFGEVRSTDTKLIEEFNVSAYPTIVGLSDPNVYYSGDYNRDKLEKWVRDFLYSEVTKKKNSYKELTKGLSNTGKCNAGDSSFCFIWFVEKDDDISISLLKKISESYAKDSISFYWVDKHKYREYAKAFDTEVIVLRGKRKKFVKINCEYDIKCISDTLSLILSGGGQFVKIDPLPELIENKTEL